jgi:formylglycine-generating enzyme
MKRSAAKPSTWPRPQSNQWEWALAVVLLGAVAALAFYTIRSRPPRSVDSAAWTLSPAPTASVFAPTIPNLMAPSGPAPEGMVWIPGGEFSMGSNDPRASMCGGPDAMDDARPIHRVYVDGFWMDTTEVTNEQFEIFVKATHYVTIAERKPTREEFPTAPPDNLVAGSTVFTPTPDAVPLNDYFQWWRYQKGANWRHPEGPETDLKGRRKYPVVHIAYDDAVAYAKWAGKRLPTEAEFEFAARGGLSGKVYAWGDEPRPGGKWMANIFQGKFPMKDAGEDGLTGIAPVAQFPPNGYGLYDVAGNVWEWVSDWYRADAFAQLAAGRGGPQPQGTGHPLRPR